MALLASHGADVLGLENLSQSIRQDFDRELAEVASRRNMQSTVLSSMREFIHNINFRYAQSETPRDVASFQRDLHDLWYMFIRAAQITDGDDPNQDGYITLLMYAKELSNVYIPGNLADTSNASGLWTDLPYLVDDVREAWETQSRDLSPAHRRNFAAFTARLLGLGICNSSSISCCVLWLLCEALETSRPLLISTAGNKGGEKMISISEILPAAVQCFEFSSHRLLALAVENQSSTGDSIAGELAKSAGVVQAGHSIPRWIFWRTRLRELCGCGDIEVEKVAKQGFDAMISCGRLMGLSIPGEAKYWARVEKALEEELARGGKVSVSMEDICIDLGVED